jgi:hypothetical protein
VNDSLPPPDRPWLTPRSREGRNEQRKLLGAGFNAGAIALLIAAGFGDILNPSLAVTLTAELRTQLALAGIAMHLCARLAVRGMEDR